MEITVVEDLDERAAELNYDLAHLVRALPLLCSNDVYGLNRLVVLLLDPQQEAYGKVTEANNRPFRGAHPLTEE